MLALTVGFVATILISLLVAAHGHPKVSSVNRASYFRSAEWRFVQSVITCVSLLSFIWRSLKTDDGPDYVSAMFLVMVIVVAVLPWVSKIVFPKAELDLIGDDAKADVLALTQNAEAAELAMARAAKFVSEHQAELALHLKSPTHSLVDKREAIMRILDVACESLSVLIRPLPPAVDASPDLQPAEPEELRITAWLSASNRTKLAYFHGWPAATTKHLKATEFDFKDTPSQDVFAEAATRNYRFLPTSQRPAKNPAGTSDFCGMLLVPIVAGGQTFGVLQIERIKMEAFGSSQVVVAKALAALFAAVP